MRKVPDRPDVKRSSSKVWWVLGGLLVLGAVVGNAGDDSPTSGSTSTTSTSFDTGSYEVTYTVTDAHVADITYQNENADTSQDGDTRLPWTYSFTAEEGEFVYVSAQNASGVGGTITCEIAIDGVTAESNSSRGPYAICTASGNL